MTDALTSRVIRLFGAFIRPSRHDVGGPVPVQENIQAGARSPSFTLPIVFHSERPRLHSVRSLRTSFVQLRPRSSPGACRQASVQRIGACSESRSLA
jgi:hypothetical protein